MDHMAHCVAKLKFLGERISMMGLVVRAMDGWSLATGRGREESGSLEFAGRSTGSDGMAVDL